MNWDADKIIDSYFDDEKLKEIYYLDQQVNKRGIAYEDPARRYCIAYQVCVNNAVPELDVQECYTIDYFFCSSASEIVDLTVLFEVMSLEYYERERLVHSSRSDWKEKLKEGIEQTIEYAKESPLTFVDLRKQYRKNLIDYIPVIKWIFPEMLEDAKRTIFINIKKGES